MIHCEPAKNDVTAGEAHPTTASIQPTNKPTSLQQSLWRNLPDPWMNGFGAKHSSATTVRICSDYSDKPD